MIAAGGPGIAAGQTASPPAAGASASASASPAAPPASPAPAPAGSADSEPDPYAVRPVELWLGVGYGDAVCDEKPDTEGGDCIIDGALALNLGGLWRYSQAWGVGLELGSHSFAVNETWRGQLDDPATEVNLAASYLAAFFRWYPLHGGPVVAYTQLGVGAGQLGGQARNATSKYEVSVDGWVAQLGVGGEAYLGRSFRLGPQALAYLLKGTEKCETNDGVEVCDRARGGDAALPWRLSLQATLLLDI